MFSQYMRRCLCTMVALFSLAFLPLDAFAGDIPSQIMAGRQDLLALVEVTAQEPQAVHLRVRFSFPQSQLKGIQTTHIFTRSLSMPMKDGGLYFVSLDRQEDGFVPKWGIYEMTGHTYQTAKFKQSLNVDLAFLQWFIQSGGKDTQFFSQEGKAYVSRDGKDLLIYPTNDAVYSELFRKALQPNVRSLFLLMGIGCGTLIVSLAFLFRRKKVPSFVYLIIASLAACVLITLFVWVRFPSEERPTTQSTSFLTSDQAIASVQRLYPELEAYPSDTLPPKRIQLERVSAGWYVGFMQLGSGVPLIEARCFFVGTDQRVESRGSYRPSNPSVRRDGLDLTTCQ